MMTQKTTSKTVENQHDTVGVGTNPSTFVTGYRYSKMGYTTIMNPSMPPLEAKHTHEELNDTPLLDKASYPLLGDWWFVLEYLQKGNLEECAKYVAWMMGTSKGYAIKIVNPGGLEAWALAKRPQHRRHSQAVAQLTGPHRGLVKVNKMTRPNYHLHTNNLSLPSKAVTTLDTMKAG
jgi:formylmethanofuran dehydrogenase subunit A